MQVKVIITMLDGTLLEQETFAPFKSEPANEIELAREIIDAIGFKFEQTSNG